MYCLVKCIRHILAFFLELSLGLTVSWRNLQWRSSVFVFRAKYLQEMQTSNGRTVPL